MKIFLATITIAIISIVLFAAVYIGRSINTKETFYIVGQFACSSLDDSGKAIILKGCKPMQGTAESEIEIINPTNILKFQGN